MLIPNGVSEIRDGVTYGLTGDPDAGPTPANLPARTQDAITAALKSSHFGGGSAWPAVGEQLYAGLRRGIPLPLAIMEAILQQAFNDTVTTFDHIGDALAAFLAQFGIKWKNTDDAQDAASYALAQLAASTRPIVDLFDSPTSGLPSANWDVFHSGGGGHLYQNGKGRLDYAYAFGIAADERLLWNAADTASDLQVISTVMPRPVDSAFLGSNSSAALCGRVNSAFNTFVYGGIDSGGARIGCRVSGTTTPFASNPVTVGAGDAWDFYVGDTTPDLYHFTLIRNGVIVVDYTDSAMVSQAGPGYRSVGLEVVVADRNFFTAQTSPGTFAVFSADDQ